MIAALWQGVVIVDAEGRLIQANAAAARILGSEMTLGSPFATWGRGFVARRTSDGSPLSVGATVMRTGEEACGIDVTLERGNGTTAALSVDYLPLAGPAGRPAGLVLSFRDVTVQQQERRRLVELQDRLREAHEAARLSSWEWHPETDDVIVLQPLAEEGALPGPHATFQDLLRPMSVADRQAARADIAEFVSGQRDTSTRRYQYRLPGVTLWMESRSRAVRADDGSLLCVRGTAQDVTARHLAQLQLQAEHDRFQGTLDSLTAHIAVLDEFGEVVMTNRAWTDFAERAGLPPTVNYLAACDATPGEPWARVAAGVRAIITGTTSAFSAEYPISTPSGGRWFSMQAVRYAGPGAAAVVLTHEDVTERHDAQGRVATQAALLDEVDMAVVATDTERRVTDWNVGAERLYGWTQAEAVGRRAADLIIPPGSAEGPAVTRELETNGQWQGDLTVRRKDGSTFPAAVRASQILDGDGEVCGSVGVSTDMTERVCAERTLLEARDHTRAIADCMGEGLFTVDDEGRVTYVNAAAEAMLGWSHEELLGRVMHDVSSHSWADGSSMAMEDCRILHARRDGHAVHVDDEVFRSRDGRDVPVAYTASPIVTDEGARGCVVVFHDISERKAQEKRMRQEVEKLAWITRIREALAEDRFVLHAQPIVDLATGAVVQRELLLRMLGADGEVIAPGCFLPTAEEYGLVSDLDRWVIERAVGLAASGSSVELNISGQSIGRPDVLEHLERCLEQTGADPALLVFELTETAIIEDQSSARAFAERLHAIGCKLALDDFGTGYGGFTYLKQLPVDFLKIDIEFVRDLVENVGSRHVVQAVVELARGFGLQTVAEGVEDAKTLELLRDLGVDLAQGFHIARPQPLETPE